MNNCFKWIEFGSTLCTTAPGQIEGMVDNKDLDVALDSYFDEVEGNNNGDDNLEARTKLEDIFKVVAGEDGIITWAELKGILDKTFQRDMELDSLSQSTCRTLIALVDKDRVGNLGITEFSDLWNYINSLKSVFLSNDVNNQGHLDEEEAKSALSQSGLEVSDKVINSLAIRYGDGERRFTFEDYLVCAVKIKIMTDLFKGREVDETITISMPEFVETTLYC